MGINANKVATGNKGGGDRIEQPVLEAGVYPGRLVQVIDLGLQPQRPYQGQEKPPAPEIMLTYELVDVFMLDADGKELEDKPRWISEVIVLNSLKAEKAKSTQRYYALDPNEDCKGDFGALVNAPVNVTIVINEGKGANAGKRYANVGGLAAMRPRDAAKCAELKNPPKVFDLDNPDMTIFGSLPEWIQEKIKGNLNYEGSNLARIIGGGAAPDKAPAPEVEESDEDQDRPF